MNPRGDCTIAVESTIEGTKCRKCGREIRDFHGVDEWITLRHLPILGRRVYLRIRPKRYRCPYCEEGPTTTQELSWYEAKSPPTKAYERYLLLQLVHATIADVSIKEEMGDKALEGIVDRWISTEVKWAEVKKVKVLGLDEIALKKLCLRQRKNSLFYATAHSAYIASLLTSVIATCLQAGVNALEYLVALQEHRQAVFAAPAGWLPWTYPTAGVSP